ncbi:MAG: TlyA family RNA methyltransferase [Eubacteriales bacterium]|nr:TlyA family RNA methyltransferase [Eubacteriales bacterium]MDD3883215.1 TlyA family RNA methyltransferase [Eubacteriales bacterium]MDD4512709.1 TlyA family RNA methyltransferase [Eubacteriales bacterium]
MTKERIDVSLVARGLCDSRAKAQALVMAGQVYIGEQKVLKSSQIVTEADEIIVRGGKRFASRGGYKLEKALKSFNADVTGKVCMDIGAATGGFTDVLLKSGAKHVYAIDVGYGQLDWSLRNDERVTVMEHTNARHLKPEDVPLMPKVTVMDVSFISIKLIIPVAASLMGDGGVFYTLVKPQFEAGRERVGKKGVVSDKKTHIDVLKSIVDFAPSVGCQVRALDFSPITGPEGNIEFLAHITGRDETAGELDDAYISELVERAHAELKK